MMPRVRDKTDLSRSVRPSPACRSCAFLWNARGEGKNKSMARINVDEELRNDPRLDRLSCLMPKHEAVGAIIVLWWLGQSYWKKDKGLIPSHIFWMTPRAQELIDVGFAETREGGVYCRGAAERWGFLNAASEHGKKGGQRSAEIRRERYGSAVPMNARNQTEAPSNKTEHPSENPSVGNRSKTEAKSSQPNPSSSSSSSSSKDLRKELRVASKLAPVGPTGKGLSVSPRRNGEGPQKFVAAYCEAFKSRYRTRPVLDGAALGEVRRIVTGVGVERACLLAQAYLQLSDRKYLAKCHDLTSLRMDLNRISVSVDTGRSSPHEKDWTEIVNDKDRSITDESN